MLSASRGAGYLPLTREALAPIMGSTRYALSPDAKHVELLGQDRSHHLIDPHLDGGLDQIGAKRRDIPTFRRRERCFDLCLEDSWSGWFLAPTLRALNANQSAVIVHLDDHADMMPTLFVQDPTGAIRDPQTNQAFDPTSQASWETAIASGAVTIGSWLTALVASPGNVAPQIHIRHIRPAGDRTETSLPKPLNVGTTRYQDLLEDRFVAIDEGGENHGSLQTDSDPNHCLADLPNGKIAVHIDLDYFANDYNGNPGTTATEPDHAKVTLSMDKFFGALDATNQLVDQWIVATSPGFCCARHWPWLLAELEERIASRKHQPHLKHTEINNASSKGCEGLHVTT